MIEIIITLLILGSAGFILFKNVKKSANGECSGCSSSSTCSASASCPKCETKSDIIILKK